MSKSVESTRRELFEQRMSIPESVSWSDETKSYVGQNFWLVDYAWEAFNAALDAVEIDLPLVYDYPDTTCMRNGCMEAIESLNLGIKIK